VPVPVMRYRYRYIETGVGESTYMQNFLAHPRIPIRTFRRTFSQKISYTQNIGRRIRERESGKKKYETFPAPPRICTRACSIKKRKNKIPYTRNIRRRIRAQLRIPIHVCRKNNRPIDIIHTEHKNTDPWAEKRNFQPSPAGSNGTN
jgi:hypothetical protein